jgi:hypothetical protein
MLPPANILLLILALLPCSLHGEEDGFKISSEGGISFATASRNIRWRGPNTVSFQKWKLNTQGQIEAFFDRVLVKDEGYHLRPKIRSAVITAETILYHDGQHILTSPHLIWLESKQVLRAQGPGILFHDQKKGWLKSTSPSSSIELNLSGKPLLKGTWTTPSPAPTGSK